MLGDSIEAALSVVGITSDRVEKWLGTLCNCEERKQKLNRLDLWARRVLRGKTQAAREYIEGVLDENH